MPSKALCERRSALPLDRFLGPGHIARLLVQALLPRLNPLLQGVVALGDLGHLRLECLGFGFGRALTLDHPLAGAVHLGGELASQRFESLGLFGDLRSLLGGLGGRTASGGGPRVVDRTAGHHGQENHGSEHRLHAGRLNVCHARRVPRGLMELQASSLRGRELYRLLTSLIVPRPIAWVGTRSTAGVDNLAPFSFFMGVTSKPPSVAISVARAGRNLLKDTAENILETGVFTVSIPSVSQLEQVATSAARFGSDTSEFDRTGLTAVSGSHVAAPFPKEARVALECRLIHSHDLGTAHLLVGEVLAFHFHDDVLTELDGRALVDASALDPLARLGGLDYAGLGERHQHAIPSVED